jgi:DNA gyrase/topoisomerase IV subunit A
MDFSAQQLRDRLHIIEGLLRASDLWNDISDAVYTCEDRLAARQALQQPPFSFSEVQALHVLDAPLGQRTAIGRRRFEEERDRFLAAMKALGEAET